MRVLLVEDNDGDADLIGEALSTASGADIELCRTLRLSAARERLASQHFDVVLLDLSLPDASGLEALHGVRAAAPRVSIVVLTGNVDGSVGLRAIQEGAQDYLVKTDLKSTDLLRAIRYARERAQHVDRVRSLADVSVALGGTLEPERMIEALREILVVRFADWCEIAGTAAADGDATPLSFRPESTRSSRPPGLFASLARSGAGDTRTHPKADELLARGFVSAITTSFSVSGWQDGEVTVARSSKSSPYGPVDFELMEEITRRLASAIEHASLLACALRERERAEVAVRFRDEFLATLSHELRTPLNAIVGWASLLRAGKVPVENQPQAIDTIARNAASQMALIEDILDVSVIITGKIRLQVAPVDIAGVVASALESARPAAEAKGVNVDADVPANLETVQADADRLLQILWNLLSNAVKFTPRGGRVDLKVRVVDGSLEVSVVDSGRGISEQFLPHVFERFRQSDSSITRASGGLGLGLAIAHHLAEAQGGTLEASSDGLGKGATFVLRLPLVGSPHSTRIEPPARVLSEAKPIVGASTLLGYAILVVDDDEDSRELLSVILEQSGATVRAAASGEEALILLQKETPHVLISDVGMPLMSGFELISRVRALAPLDVASVKAIALTAYASIEDQARALRNGFDRHVSKPLAVGALESAILELRAPDQDRAHARTDERAGLSTPDRAPRSSPSGPPCVR